MALEIAEFMSPYYGDGVPPEQGGTGRYAELANIYAQGIEADGNGAPVVTAPGILGFRDLSNHPSAWPDPDAILVRVLAETDVMNQIEADVRYPMIPGSRRETTIEELKSGGAL